MAEGASGVHASGPSRIGLPPAPGGVVGALRPAWASCTPSLATPYCRQKSCTRLSAASFSSEYMPAHFGEMRPCGLTLVISHITSPAAPSDILPRCIRCQSLAEPLLELYWHIGETTTRFGSVRPRMRSEEHTSELQSRQYLVCRLLLEKKQQKQYQKCLLDKKKKTRKRLKRSRKH